MGLMGLSRYTHEWGRDLVTELGQVPGIVAQFDYPAGPEYELWPDVRGTHQYLPHPYDIIVYIGAHPDEALEITSIVLNAAQIAQQFLKDRIGKAPEAIRRHVRTKVTSRSMTEEIDLTTGTLTRTYVEEVVEREISTHTKE
jgi:hypothetical protein